jgi:predicted  nucleic acid-binding Zn-ribbon protein
VPEPVARVDKKNLGLTAKSPGESLKPSGNQQDKVKAKIEEHSARLDQFENLVRAEKAALQKWKDRVNDESETTVTGVSDL